MEKLADVHLLNVRQGDSIVIRLVSGEVIIVDCHRPCGKDKPPTIDLLEELGCQNIDVLCLTHPDSDHYSGMEALLDWVDSKNGSVKSVIMYSAIPRQVASLKAQMIDRFVCQEGASPELRRLVAKHQRFNGLYRKLRKVITGLAAENYARASGFKLFKRFAGPSSAKVFILGPTDLCVERFEDDVWDNMLRAWLGEKEENESANEISCVLWIQIGQTKILLTGDATNEALSEAIQAYKQNPQDEAGKDVLSDIIKASHHGSRSGSSEEFWSMCLQDKSVVVFSAGAHRKYKHPHQETVNHIRAVNRSTELICTNWCEAYRQKWKKNALPVDIASAFADELPDSRRFRDLDPHLETTYHGTITFEIYDDGQIELKPENNPKLTCDNH